MYPLMRTCFITILMTSVLHSLSQDSIKGVLYSYRTKKQISLPANSQPTVNLSSNDEFGKRKSKTYKVNENGTFLIPLTDLDTLGDNLTFYIWSFNDITVSKEYNYADFEIKNISRTSIANLLSVVYLIPAYWTISGGSDNYLIDNKKTFKQKQFIINTTKYKYRVKREPEIIKQTMLDVKYVVDFKKDLIE